MVIKWWPWIEKNRQSIGILLIISICCSNVVKAGDCPSETDDSNFYAIRSILDNMVRGNDTLLHHLAGVFSNENNPLKQVVVTYELCIRTDNCEKDCTFNTTCRRAEFIKHGSCHSDYYCITTDPFIWARYPATARDLIFRDLDACPLVIGNYRQDSLTIYFNISTPPSCNSSLYDNITIENGEFPCGWQCVVHSRESNDDFKGSHPSYLFFDDVLIDESHLDKALLRITSKLLQYATIKREDIPGFSYDPKDYLGYAKKYNFSRYLHRKAVPAEYGIFLFAYFSLHVMLMVITIDQGEYYEIFKKCYSSLSQSNSSTEDKFNSTLFFSFIITSIVVFCTLLWTTLTEGGVCITVLQLLVIGFSLFPAFLVYIILSIIWTVKNNELNTDNTCKRRCRNCLLIVFPQLIVCLYVLIFPHIIVMLSLMTVVSFIYHPSGTSILIIYFCSSSVILWIANAVAIHFFLLNAIYKKNQEQESIGGRSSSEIHVNEERVTDQTRSADGSQSNENTYQNILNKKTVPKINPIKRIVFAISLLLSFNLMNWSIMPFIGDYYYDRRANVSILFSIMIPVVFTVVGWYFSGKLIRLYHEFDVTHPNHTDSLIGEVGEVLYHVIVLLRKLQNKKKPKLYTISDITEGEDTSEKSFKIKVVKQRKQ